MKSTTTKQTAATATAVVPTRYLVMQERGKDVCAQAIRLRIVTLIATLRAVFSLVAYAAYALLPWLKYTSFWFFFGLGPSNRLV